MAEILKLGPGIFTIGETGTATEFGGRCTVMAITPEHETDDELQFLDGTSESGGLTTSWTAGGEFVQDYITGNLANWAAAQNGKRLPFRFVPSTAGVTEVTGTLEVRAVKIGGDVKKKNTSEFEFPVIGDPVIGETYTAATTTA